MKSIIKNKTRNILVFVLMLTLTSALLSYLPLVSATELPTYSYVVVAPNPVGVGQTVTVTFFSNRVAPVFEGVPAWENLTLIVTNPSGVIQELGPLKTDSAGIGFTSYTPDMVGTYSFQLNFPMHMTFFGNIYLPSTSEIDYLIVQEDEVTYLPQTPLPEDYWTRPINSENRFWSSISGNWLAEGYEMASLFTWNAYNPYTKAPNSAHIVWTKPIAFGGLIGGKYDSKNYYTGLSYEQKFLPPIIMNGILYYNTPDPPRYGFTAIDLRTGEELWYQNYTGSLTMGQIFHYYSGNQHAGHPYLWDQSTTTWHMYDAFTGNWILDLENATVPSFAFGSTTPVTRGPNVEHLMYILAGTPNPMGPFFPAGPPFYLQLWNSTVCFEQTGIIQIVPQTGVGSLRPTAGTYDWSKGIQWNVSVPAVEGGISLAAIDLDSGYLLATSVQSFGSTSPGWQMQIGYDATTGEQLWVENRTTPVQGSINFGFMGPMKDGVYTTFTPEEFVWNGYNAATGEQMWGPSTSPVGNALNFYPTGLQGGSRVVVDGILYSANYDGVVHAFDIQNGTLLWDFVTESPGLSVPYPNTPFYGGISAADGKIFAPSITSFPPSPLWQGMKLYSIDAITGENVWNVTGWYTSIAIADGYLVTLNNYDQQIYCFGKGQTETTVSAAPKVSAWDDIVLIEGKVTDQSSGAAGTPAIADEYMIEWMEYLYMQKPCPDFVEGVEVKLETLDPNGNFYEIDTVTSDANGMFSVMWKPPVPGKYTISPLLKGQSLTGVHMQRPL